jgi:hypothetical protein
MAKSRLVVQAHNDKEKTTVLTQSPTIQRVSQRLTLCLFMIFWDIMKLYLRDIAQAYISANKRLQRRFLLRAPIELSKLLGIPFRSILECLLLLYGIPESGNIWYGHYLKHYFVPPFANHLIRYLASGQISQITLFH